MFEYAVAEELGACRHALDRWMEYNEGAPLTMEEVVDHGRVEWWRWLVVNYPGLSLPEREELCTRSNYPPGCRGEVAMYAPGLTRAEREAFCERSDCPTYWRGKVAALRRELRRGEKP